MILIVYGTRPEIIKLFPLINELKAQGLPFKTAFTGQHLDLYEDVRDLIPEPDYLLNSDYHDKASGLGDSFCRIGASMEHLLKKSRFDIIVVQGDTTSACAVAQIGFYNHIKVAHVEAGLRTYDVSSPFPEEINRRFISQVSGFNFAPTAKAKEHLESEGAQNIYLTGNTIVDSLDFFNLPASHENQCLITLHRRENHHVMPELFRQINETAARYPGLEFVFPIHPNPNVRKHRGILEGSNLHVIEPVGYQDMLGYLSRALFIISDSGGLQEEAVYFGKKILIVRNNTERPETVETGLGRLVGHDILGNLDWVNVKADSPSENPFGDGKASKRIADIIRRQLYDN